MESIKNIIKYYVEINDYEDFIIIDKEIYYDVNIFQNFLQRISKITIPKFYSLTVRDGKSLARKSYQLRLLNCKEQWFLTKNREILEIMEDNFYTTVIGLDGINRGHMIMLIHDVYNKFYVVDSSGASKRYPGFDMELTRLIGDYEYCHNACNLQRIESYVENEENEPDGYCLAWSHFLAACCHSLDDDIDDIISQILIETESDPLTIRKLIRGFTYSVFTS